MTATITIAATTKANVDPGDKAGEVSICFGVGEGEVKGVEVGVAVSEGVLVGVGVLTGVGVGVLTGVGVVA